MRYLVQQGHAEVSHPQPQNRGDPASHLAWLTAAASLQLFQLLCEFLGDDTDLQRPRIVAAIGLPHAGGAMQAAAAAARAGSDDERGYSDFGTSDGEGESSAGTPPPAASPAASSVASSHQASSHHASSHRASSSRISSSSDY
jgi:hypothetical protein